MTRDTFMTPVARANNSNLLNSQGQPPRSQIGKTSRSITQIIAAGDTLPLAISGDRFYVIAASGPVNIRPRSSQNGPGADNPWFQGTGVKLHELNTFDTLDVQNPNASESLYINLWVGFEEYDDRRLTFPSIQFSQIVHPIYDWVHPTLIAPVPAGPPYSTINVPDLKGTVIADTDGDLFFALFRTAILVFNESLTQVVRFGRTLSGPGQVYNGCVYPRTTAQLPFTGDQTFYSSDGASIGSYISEIYTCVPKP